MCPTFERDIGLVFQSYAIWPHMDVFANVAYPLRVQRPRLAAADIKARVMDALRLVGMESYATAAGDQVVGRPAAACRLRTRSGAPAEAPAAR